MTTTRKNSERWLTVYDSVQWFAERMLFKLWKHRDKEFWLNHPTFTMDDAIHRMGDETLELIEAVAEAEQTGEWQLVVNEAADVANFAMMVAQMAYELDKNPKDDVLWQS